METGKSVDTSNDISATQDDSPATELTCSQELIAEPKPGEIVRNLQNVSYVYRQDVVKSNINGKIGIVAEVAGDSDSDGSLTDDDEDEDEDDDEEEDDDEDVGDDAAQVDNDDKVDGTSNADGHRSHHLPADQVRILWIDESETTERINDVKVLDRGFLHGDYVASASDPTGQVGVVVDVNISVDLLTRDGYIIEDINAKDLTRVRDFTVGDYVVLGPWLGRIDDVLDNVTVLFDDGSVCKVMKADPLHLKPVGKNILEDGHFPFYPGQRVRATSSSVFKNSRWLSGLWKANRLEGTVTKVTVGSVFIYWIASAGYGPDSSTTPAEEQCPKNLKLLSCFSHANWQLGDWCLLPSSVLSACIPLDKGLLKSELSDSAKEESESVQTGTESSEIVNPEESNENSESQEIDREDSLDSTGESGVHKTPAESSSCTSSLSVSKESVIESWPLHRKKIRKVVVRRDKKAKKKEENFERALLIVNTRTTADVVWQDGTIGHGTNSTNLIPIESPGDHEFVAEQYVIEKAADDVNDAGGYRRVGVVRNVNAKEKTAQVRWLRQIMRAEDPREFDKEEVVSVYELEGHPDYDYCYGDVVVRLSPVTVSIEISSSSEEPELPQGINELKQDVEKQTGCETTEASLTDGACTEFSDLSWVGNITGLRDGDIEVTWADGMVSMVGPQAIYVVGRDDDESMGGGSEISDDAASWETVEDDEMETLESATEDIWTQSATDISLENEDGSENSGRYGALAIPLAALGFVTRLASGIFSRGRKHTDPDSRSEGGFQPRDFAVKGDSDTESCSKRSNGDDSVGGLSNKVTTAQHDDNESAELLDVAVTLSNLNSDANSAQLDNEMSSFKRFDISKDPYDHYFLGANKQNNTGKKWLRKVQQDWSILQNNLPDGVYVRVYEDRMDLLRAVIVGAYGTPYQDGLFFFDFHLPPEYPDVPPSAYYHSGGWRINPNLYEEGKVCLSLLNTWTGRGNEVWDSSSSSILQVLVSLQGLVLNSKPYFNEAGYDKQIGTAEGEKNSLSYNENTFLLNCKTMMYLIRKPPKDFEELVQEHFRKRGYYILKACDAYMKGYLIGSLAKDASVSSSCDAKLNSIGFKLMLAKLVTKLYSSLGEIGADCQEFKHLQNSS